MSNLFLKKADRKCDFCGFSSSNNQIGPFVSTHLDTDRDICLACVKEALELFNESSLINRTINMFNAIMRRLLDSKTKTLIRAGFLNKDLSLTSQGEEALLALSLTQHMEELVKQAEEKIEEDKEEKE